MGDELLRAVDDPAVAVTYRARLHRGRVASRGSLRQSPRCELLALRQRHQITLLLFLGPERGDVRRAKTVVCRHRQTDRRIDAGELLDADAVVHRRHRRPAIRFRELDPHQPQRGEFRRELRRIVLRFVPFAHVRTNLGLRELADRAPQQRLLLAQPQIHLSAPVKPIVSFGMRHLWIVLLLVLSSAVPAFADATAFIGSTTTPANRPTKGVAVGIGLVIIGFEFEYASASETPEDAAPGLRTGMGNVLLQTPISGRRHAVLRDDRRRALPREPRGAAGNACRLQLWRRREDLAAGTAQGATRLPRVQAAAANRCTRSCTASTQGSISRSELRRCGRRGTRRRRPAALTALTRAA